MEADPESAAGKTERFVNGLARGPMMFQIMVNRVVELLDATVLPNDTGHAGARKRCATVHARTALVCYTISESDLRHTLRDLPGYPLWEASLHDVLRHSSRHASSRRAS